MLVINYSLVRFTIIIIIINTIVLIIDLALLNKLTGSCKIYNAQLHDCYT